jgi:hypothetical protein
MLEGGAIVVVGVTIGLDDHARARPKEVDEYPLDEDIDLGGRQAGLPTESQEVDLQRRAGIDGMRVHLVDEASESAHSLSAPGPFDDLSKRRPAQTPTAIGLDQKVLQLASIKAPGDVEGGPLERGDRDSGLDRDVFRWQGARLMKPNAVRAPMAGKTGHLDQAPRAPHPPEVSGAPAGKDGAGPSGKNRGHPSALCPMSDGKDPAVHGQQDSPNDALPNRPTTQTERNQLPPGNHSMLPFGQLTDSEGPLIPRRNVL